MTPEDRMEKYSELHKRVEGKDISITHDDGWYKVNSYFYNTAGDIDRIISEMEASLTPAL